MSLFKHFFSKQFIFFLIIGCLNTFNGVIFAALFNLLMHPTIAFILGYACSLLISYWLNSTFVFKQPLQFIRFIKFVLSYIPNFIIQLVCVMMLIELLQLNPILVYTVAAIIGVPITFLVMKLFAFKK